MGNQLLLPPGIKLPNGVTLVDVQKLSKINQWTLAVSILKSTREYESLCKETLRLIEEKEGRTYDKDADNKPVDNVDNVAISRESYIRHKTQYDYLTSLQKLFSEKEDISIPTIFSDKTRNNHLVIRSADTQFNSRSLYPIFIGLKED